MDDVDTLYEFVTVDEWETEQLDGYKVKARKFSDNHPEHAGELHVFITNRKGKLLSETQYTQMKLKKRFFRKER